MSRPTIALACILKNEVENLPILLESVHGCFDEIHLTDTGSTDGSLEWIEANKEKYNIQLHHFEWIQDFSAARNASFNPVKTDFIMWMDLDDSLSDKDTFINWRDSVMKIGDYWVATYNYAFHSDGRPSCSFARERVVKRSRGFTWNYFVHEGMMPSASDKEPVAMHYATTWHINHRRTLDDMNKDRKRNLSLFEKRKDTLDARMHYYYGKELFENADPLTAFGELIAASADPKLEGHDRLMALQYGCMAAMQMNQFEKAIQLAHQGLQLEPQRAEYHVIIGDCYIKLGKFLEAIPFYTAASSCVWRGGGKIQQALYTHEDSYKHYPLNQLARVYANLGDPDKAMTFAEKAAVFGPNAETIGIIGEIKALKDKSGVGIHLAKTKKEEIVISCHPMGPYEWDEDVIKTQGIGGSETAVIEMARSLSDKTGLEVKIFNNRQQDKTFGRVSYLSAQKLPLYLAENKPRVHVAWRHNIKLTNAPSYVWCHDLVVPGLESEHYEKVLALSNFHKGYLANMFGVNPEKIFVTRNGIAPERFTEQREKTRGMVVWGSSPDRGLLRALKVMDEVVKVVPEVKLHVFYGFDNMIKLGKLQEVENFKKEIFSRPHVSLRGNVSKQELTNECQKAEVWLYPTDFLETFCITALEMLCTKTYPVVRQWGGLEDTLAIAKQKAMCTMLDNDCVTEAEISWYAKAVTDAMNSQLYKGIDINPQDFSWGPIADQWIELFGL